MHWGFTVKPSSGQLLFSKFLWIVTVCICAWVDEWMNGFSCNTGTRKLYLLEWYSNLRQFVAVLLIPSVCTYMYPTYRSIHTGVANISYRLSFQQFYKFMLNKQVPLNDSLAKSKGERIPAFCAEYSDVLLLCSNFVAVIFSHLSAYFPARYIYIQTHPLYAHP